MDSTLIPKKYSAVTPSDTLGCGPTIGLFVGVGGTLTVKGDDGVSATFLCGNSQYIPGSFTQVMATGTLATNIVALRS